MIYTDKPSRRHPFSAIEWCIVVAVLLIAIAIVVPVKTNPTTEPWYVHAYEGWTWVGKTHNGDDIYMRYLPERHITVYSTWRGMSVVKD